MPVMDEFREEREALKNSSFKVKFQYFLDYYKWPVIAVIAGILILISIIKDVTTSKDFIFYGFFLNCYGEDPVIQAFMDDFSQVAQLDTENYEVFLDNSLSLTMNAYDESSMATVSRIMVSVTAGDLDFMASDPPVFDHYATTDTFYDLRLVLTEEQLKTYEPYLYYVDYAEVRRKTEGLDEYEAKVYDHTNPDIMEEPIPVGLYINNSEKLSKVFLYKEKEAIMGIPHNAKHIDTSVKFIEYIFE